MIYREAAQRERPVERLVLRKSRMWGLQLVLIAGIAIITWMSYGTVKIDCVRPMAGEVARCTASATFENESSPFPLERGSIRAGRTAPDSKSRRYPVLLTPTAVLKSGVDKEFAERTEGEADRFYEDTDRLEWHAGQTKWVFSAIFDSVLGFMMFAFIYGRRKRTLDLDPNLRMVAFDGHAWPLDDVEDIVLDWDKDDRQLNFMMKGERVSVCTGNEATIENAAKRIRAVQKEAR